MTPPADGRPIVWPHEAVQALKVQLNRDTILQARSALLAEADRLDRGLADSYEGAKVGLCGRDPVSADAAAAFNERIEKLVVGCRAYNQELREAAHTLDETARQYGYTDEERSRRPSVRVHDAAVVGGRPDGGGTVWCVYERRQRSSGA